MWSLAAQVSGAVTWPVWEADHLAEQPRLLGGPGLGVQSLLDLCTLGGGWGLWTPRPALPTPCVWPAAPAIGTWWGVGPRFDATRGLNGDP